MKKQIKWSFAIVTVGAIGLGIFSQFPNEENENIGEQPYFSMESTQNQQGEQIKIKALKKTNLTKNSVIHNHIEHDIDSVESFDEMEIFDDSIAGIHLQKHFDLLENTEPGSQERQDESFEKMRENPEVYVEKLAETYDELGRQSFLARYKVVYMMENIKSTHAIPFLSELANSERSEETAPYKGDGHIDEAHRENLIRMRAVGGLYTLASAGDIGARNSLFDTILVAKDRTVKNDAIWSYLSTSKNLGSDKEFLKSVLPEEEHQFVVLKLSNIEDIQEQMGFNGES